MQSDRPRARDRREIDTFVRGALRIDLAVSLAKSLINYYANSSPAFLLAFSRERWSCVDRAGRSRSFRGFSLLHLTRSSRCRRSVCEESDRYLISARGNPSCTLKNPPPSPAGLPLSGLGVVDYVRKSHSRNVCDFRSVITRCAYDIFNRRLLSCSSLSFSFSRAPPSFHRRRIDTDQCDRRE